MFQQLDYKSMAELTPLAEIDVTYSELHEKGIEFAQDSDDWGEHAIAALKVSGLPGSAIALVCYIARPMTTDLFITGPTPLEDREIGSVVSLVAKVLDLPVTLFHWRSRSGEVASLRPPVTA